MISRRFALVVVVIAVLVAASFQYLNARAAQPGSGEVGPSALTATTDFAPVVGSSGGATQVAQECPPEVCDNYDLKVDAPKAGTKGSLTITYTWTNSTAGGTDLDVFAISPDGTIAGPGSPDTQPVGDGEEVLTIDASQPGTYNIRSVAGTAPTATAAHAVMTMAYTAIPKGPGPLTNQLSFAPASTVSPNLLGAEPQLQLERPVPTSLPGATNPNRGFIDWPYSSRTGTDILNRTLDGGNTWRPLVDFSCAVRNKPSCATHGGGDSINRVNLYDGTVYFGEQEEVANEALSSSTDHGDSFPTSRQHAISNAATGVDRQWIATVDAPNVTAAAGPEGTPVTLNAFYSYHIPAAGEYIQGVDSNGLLIPQPAPQIASVSQSGPSRVDENPKSPGKGYVYVSFRDTNGFEVASAPVSQYYLPTAWTVGHVSADTPAIFPWINLDRSGNLYAVWVTNGIVYYSYSLIGDPANNPHAGGTPATKWSPRIRVSPMGLGSTVFPEVVAGDPGRIAVAYDGTSDYTGISDGAPLNARWQTYASVVTDALSPHPDILTGAVSHRVIHTGSICTSGTTCTGDRSLLDMIDVQVDSQGRIGVVFTDNNNQMARDTGTAAQSTCTTSCKGDPFVEFAKITKGPSLLASVGKFKTSVPLNSRAAPAGDAKWPNTAAGVNLKSLDLRGASVTVHKGKLVATIKVASTSSAVMKADIASFNAASQGGVPYTGIQATRLSYVLTYQTAWKSASKPGDEYYLVYQFNSDGSHSSFGGKLDGTNATTGSVNAVTYNTKAAGGSAVKGKISGNTIMLSADDGHFAAEEGSRIYSVSAFSLAGPAQNLEVSASTISRMIDETPPFDAQFKRR